MSNPDSTLDLLDTVGLTGGDTTGTGSAWIWGGSDGDGGVVVQVSEELEGATLAAGTSAGGADCSGMNGN